MPPGAPPCARGRGQLVDVRVPFRAKGVPTLLHQFRRGRDSRPDVPAQHRQDFDRRHSSVAIRVVGPGQLRVVEDRPHLVQQRGDDIQRQIVAGGSNV